MDITFVLLGGLGLFLYGVDAMSKSFQRLAGHRLKGLLRTLSGNRFAGVFSGAFVTAIIQSSSVATVMVVGFVNAGLIALPQAISIILGTHIGTTITAQIIAFKIQNFALPLIALGAIITLFSKQDRLKLIGECIFGFGVLFFGLNLMGAAFDPLKNNNYFHYILETFMKNPWMGFLAGIAVTVIVQSSSVTTGITIALAMSSVITFEQAVPLILGENIGTTVTASIATIGGSYAAKQASRAHFIINVVGALLGMALLKPFMAFVISFSPATDIARQIANAHTAFNVLNTILFLPLIGVVARMTDFLIIGKKEEGELYYLEKASLEDPGTALDQVKLALLEMHGFVLQSLKLTASLFLTREEKNIYGITHFSEKIDRYQSKVSEFLENLTQKRIQKDQSQAIQAYVRVLHEIERMRDYEEKLKQVGINLIGEGRDFISVEKSELRQLFNEVNRLLQKTREVIAKSNPAHIEQVVKIYDSINAKKDSLRKRSNKRYMAHQTQVALSNYYYDVVSALEEIAKKCRNIGQAMLK